MLILVLNSGSATIKYQLLDLPGGTLLASGLVDGIGTGRAILVHRQRGEGSRTEDAVRNHREGLDRVVKLMAGVAPAAVGHRVVHGGERFREPVMVDALVLEGIRSMNPLAPLHNPANVLGIEVAREVWPSVPQVAVFDTAFHRTLPAHAYRYAVPRDLYEGHKVRRYGFHGISHAYLARRTAALLARAPESINLITLHLGNGASATAIRGGKSVDTSMGLTPLEGLVMGTRSGDVDPALPAYLARVAGRSAEEVEFLLNHESGLKALAGTNDAREIVRRAEAGDPEARLAIDLFCYRVKKYVGAYAAALGRVDAVVFAGGIGENSPVIRKRCLEDLSILGLTLDERRNAADSQAEREIQVEGAAVRILVVPTREELEIATQTMACVQSARKKP